MLGALINAAVGALAFKLGMDAQRARAEGKSLGDVISEIPENAMETVNDCYEAVKSWFSGDDEEEEEAKPKAKTKAKKTKAKPKAKAKPETTPKKPDSTVKVKRPPRPGEQA